MHFCHELLSDARFYNLLFRFDRDVAAQVRAGRCPGCKGRLDSARYPRKPKGAPTGLGAEHGKRLSFCCAACRHRVTPPSVRFLGRKIYFAAVIVLVTAMLHGSTPGRIGRLREYVGASWSTIDRWRRWWRDVFAKSEFWSVAKARFAKPVDVWTLPYSLLARFGGSVETRLICALKFIGPLTTGSAAQYRFG